MRIHLAALLSHSLALIIAMGVYKMPMDAAVMSGV
jgi:hypothetical protein